jgi:hypothetical protein
MQTKFIHLRVLDSMGKPYSTGGVTVAYKLLEENRVLFQYAICTDKDNYNKSIGRAIAGGRLEKHPHIMHVNKPELAHLEIIEAVGDLTYTHFPNFSHPTKKALGYV